jgi:hypothetical protein
LEDWRLEELGKKPFWRFKFETAGLISKHKMLSLMSKGGLCPPPGFVSIDKLQRVSFVVQKEWLELNILMKLWRGSKTQSVTYKDPQDPFLKQLKDTTGNILTWNKCATSNILLESEKRDSLMILITAILQLQRGK